MESTQVTLPPLTPDVCPVTQTLAFVGSKWTPLVIFQLHLGARRYGELQRAMPGISPKTLAERLQSLEERGLVTRTVYPDKPPRVEYALTPRGHELGDILDTIATWATA
ncbi:helix-turn-helix transcriptional regulator [Frankia sp. CNm7]|nr:helix-turn-helix transcriptional regulator [Frankia nepalensis]MBL7511426.1 helix-turn-helix transcriptional regulator [Frankia nepalensis]MBL7517059.1 helix-turn-helix transcriptional regulator [Frankia nepalensis]